MSQTSSGITIASSRRTRSQSKRLWARLVDRLLPGLLEGGEVGEGADALCLGLCLRELALEAGLLGLAVGDLVVREHDAGDPEQGDGEHRNDHVGEGAGAHRRLLATARLGGDQVDRTHALLLQGEAEGKRQTSRRSPVEVSQSPRPTDLESLTEVALETLDEPRDGGSGATGDDALDRHRTLLRGVVLERQAKLVDQPRGPLSERLARGGDRLRVALDPLERLLHAHVDEPLTGVLEGQLSPLGELLGDPLHAER